MGLDESKRKNNYESTGCPGKTRHRIRSNTDSADKKLSGVLSWLFLGFEFSLNGTTGLFSYSFSAPSGCTCFRIVGCNPGLTSPSRRVLITSCHTSWKVRNSCWRSHSSRHQCYRRHWQRMAQSSAAVSMTGPHSVIAGTLPPTGPILRAA